MSSFWLIWSWNWIEVRVFFAFRIWGSIGLKGIGRMLVFEGFVLRVFVVVLRGCFLGFLGCIFLKMRRVFFRNQICHFFHGFFALFGGLCLRGRGNLWLFWKLGIFESWGTLFSFRRGCLCFDMTYFLFLVKYFLRFINNKLVKFDWLVLINKYFICFYLYLIEWINGYCNGYNG